MFDSLLLKIFDMEWRSFFQGISLQRRWNFLFNDFNEKYYDILMAWNLWDIKKLCQK